MLGNLEFLKQMFKRSYHGREVIDVESVGWWADEPPPKEVRSLGEVQQVEVYRMGVRNYGCSRDQRVSIMASGKGIRITWRSNVSKWTLKI